MESVKKKGTAYKNIKERCDAIGAKLSEICREAGVDRSILERWKTDDPKSIKHLNALNDAIVKFEKSKKNG